MVSQIPNPELQPQDPKPLLLIAKLRYCSSACQNDDWPNHKLFCASRGSGSRDSLAITAAGQLGPGSVKQNAKRNKGTVANWYLTQQNVFLRVEFMAWQTRAESPVIRVRTASLSNEADVLIDMIPRTQWTDPDLWEPETTMRFRSFFERTGFHADEKFVVQICVAGDPLFYSSTHMFCADTRRYHGSALKTLSPDDYLAEYSRRSKGPPNAVYVRLTGLRDATRNGLEGRLMGVDPRNLERLAVRIETPGKDIQVRGPCTDISVRRQNIERMLRPKLNAEEWDRRDTSSSIYYETWFYNPIDREVARSTARLIRARMIG